MKKEIMKKSFQYKVSSLKFNRQKIIALAFFVLFGFVALQIPISGLAGSRVKFTLFDLFAPVSGAFLGTPIGIIAVFLMQIANLAFHGFANFDKGTIIRLFPILFSVWFFSKKDRNLLILPAIAIISFNLNPIGRSVWYYSLFWIIPFVAYPLSQKSLIARSLTATFIAHSVGGAIWIWVFQMPAAVWAGLIPVVIMERAIMTLGISANYVLMNNVLAYLSSKKLMPASVKFDKKYLAKTIIAK